MPEVKQIPTYTTSTVVGSLISIVTRYWNGITKVLRAFISDKVQTVEGVPFKEGEGGIQIKSGTPPSEITFYLDSSGNLIASGTDAANYSLDPQTGQLQYNY